MRKLTITVSDEVYKGLYDKIGPRKISRFIDGLTRPHVLDDDIRSGYEAMADDTVREAEADLWSEAFISDGNHETR